MHTVLEDVNDRIHPHHAEEMNDMNESTVII